MAKRNIVRIDEDKCNGCGLCVPSCQEGAIRIIDGKARLVKDSYCDGLGACLGDCPQGAITIEERDADEFDPVAVEHHLQSLRHQASPHPSDHPTVHQGCPGTLARMFAPAQDIADESAAEVGAPLASRLGNWPVQLTLLPIQAPYFADVDLVIAADCVPFAFADFHRRFLGSKTVAIGCPKLDNAGAYMEKLAEIFRRNEIRSVHVVHMEVPCCFGLVQLVRMALDQSGKDIPLDLTKIGIHGTIVNSTTVPSATESAAS